MSKVKTQEPFWTYSAETRDTRLAHEKMPEPEEEPAETTVAQAFLPGQQVSQNLSFVWLGGRWFRRALTPAHRKLGLCRMPRPVVLWSSQAGMPTSLWMRLGEGRTAQHPPFSQSSIRAVRSGAGLCIVRTAEWSSHRGPN